MKQKASFFSKKLGFLSELKIQEYSRIFARKKTKIKNSNCCDFINAFILHLKPFSIIRTKVCTSHNKTTVSVPTLD